MNISLEIKTISMQENSLLLGIDIGNTNIEFGFIDKSIKSFKVSSNYSKTPDEWILNLVLIHNFFSIDKEKVKDIVISSVVPDLTEKIKHACLVFYKKEPKVIGEDLSYPIKINYENISEVGVDRIVNSVSALKLYRPPIIIIDLGTAITFDVINKEGEYEGGAIFPGIDSSVSSLFSKTAKLPKVEIKETKSVIGKNTQKSIQSGIFYGYVSLIEGMVEKIKKEIEGNPQIILTGGHSEIITKGLKIEHKVEKDLIMLGIEEIYNCNRDK